MPELYSRTRKGTIQSPRVTFQAYAVGSMVFSSIQTTFYQEIFFTKVVVLWLSFHINLNHSILTSLDEVIPKTRKLPKYKKFWYLASLECCRLVKPWRVVTERKRDDSWRSTLLPTSPKLLLKHQSRLKTCIKHKNN